MEMKAYADAKRLTAPHDIHVGDTVLVKQPRKNKLTTAYDPQPYVIEDINGSMISASRESGKIVRNSSHFKRLDAKPEEIWITHEDPVDIVPEVIPTQTVTPEATVQEQSVPQEVVTRSGRHSKKPQWLQDYAK